MPTISVDKAGLFKALGQESVSIDLYPASLLMTCALMLYRCSYTTGEFDELCFDFGMNETGLFLAAAECG